MQRIAEGVFILHCGCYAIVGLADGNIIASNGYSELYAEILLIVLRRGGQGNNGHNDSCKYLFHNCF